MMPKRDEESTAGAGGKKTVRWYASWTVVITLALAFLLYVCVTQALIVMKDLGYPTDSFMADFLPRMLNCLGIILIVFLLAFFFAAQDYQLVILRLYEKLIPNHSVESPDQRQETYRGNNLGLFNSADGYPLIEDVIDEVLQENKDYRTQMERQRDLVAENFVTRLMKSWPKDVPMTYDMASNLGVDLHAKNLQVMVLGYDDLEGQETPSDELLEWSYQLMQNLLDRLLNIAFSGHVVEIDGMVACLVTPSVDGDLEEKTSEDELVRIAKLVCQIVAQNADITMKACLGSVCSGIAGVEQSFSEAVELFQYTRLIGDEVPVSVYRDEYSEEGDHKADYYWFKKEMQFMNCIRAEDYLNASVVFCEMVDSDYIRHVQPIKLANYRMMGLISSMIDAIDEISSSIDEGFLKGLDPWERIISSDSLPELRNNAMAIFDQIYFYTQTEHKDPTAARIDQVVVYLKKSYADSNLSLTSVANEFGVNPSYLSRCFKQKVGVGLYSYLQRIRVDAAKELMSDSDLTVKEIAERVGFNNVLTLNRTFKSLEGTTVGRLRNSDDNDGNEE